MSGYLLSISYAGFILFWLALVAPWATATIRICWIALRHAYHSNSVALLVASICFGLAATIPEIFLISSVLLGIVAGCAGVISGLLWAVDLLPSWKAILKLSRRLYVLIVIGALIDLTAECVRSQL
jgi:hypothetical protein